MILLLFAFLVSEDALVDRKNEISELPGGEDSFSSLLEIGQQDIVPWRDDFAFGIHNALECVS